MKLQFEIVAISTLERAADVSFKWEPAMIAEWWAYGPNSSVGFNAGLADETLFWRGGEFVAELADFWIEKG